MKFWIILTLALILTGTIIFILIRYHIFKKIKIVLFSGNGYFFHDRGEGTPLLNKSVIHYNQDKKVDKIRIKEIGLKGQEELKTSDLQKDLENPGLKENIIEPKKINSIKIPIKKTQENKMDMPKETINEPLKKESQKDKIKGIIPKISDKNIISILEYIADNNYNLTNLVISDKIDINKEFLETIKNQIVSFLKNRLDDIKSDTTQKRKKGVDMSYLSLKLMSVPLKIKMFEASFDKNDFFKIIETLDSLEKDLKNYPTEDK